jgi:predicted DNA-binding transcriptional regulator AlpA
VRTHSAEIAMSILSTGLSESELDSKKLKRSGLDPPLDPNLDRMIPEKDAAELRGISRDTLRRQAAAGTGPKRYRVGLRRVGYRLREVLTANEAE